MIHSMSWRNPFRLYIHLAFTYLVGPSSVVWSELGPAPPFPPMRVLEVKWSRARSVVCEVALRWLPQILDFGGDNNHPSCGRNLMRPLLGLKMHGTHINWRWNRWEHLIAQNTISLTNLTMELALETLSFSIMFMVISVTYTHWKGFH